MRKEDHYTVLLDRVLADDDRLRYQVLCSCGRRTVIGGRREVEGEQKEHRRAERPLWNHRAVALLDAIDTSDPERAHAEADEILARNADPLVREAYVRVIDRTDGWWYA